MEPSINLWALRPGAEAWEELAPMPEGRTGHGMVALDGKLYVVGGAGPSSSVLIFDTQTESWSTGAPMPAQRDHLVVLAVEGEIWAIGGRASFTELMDRVDIYGTEAGAWRTGPALPEPMSAMAGGVLPSGIHIVGGLRHQRSGRQHRG